MPEWMAADGMAQSWPWLVPAIGKSSIFRSRLWPCSKFFKTMAEMGMEGYGVTLLAIHSGMETLANPPRDLRLEVDDVVVLLGPPDKVDLIRGLFRLEDSIPEDKPAKEFEDD
jgi:uncharacterized protein with PhoU and TrkA domain